jgi:DnaJ-class molecular chaperone
MKQIDDQTYYEVLGVSFNADSEQIQSAYSELLSIYDTDSLSTYSLFSETERQTILDQAKKAFKALMDTRKREKYDTYLIDAGHVTSAAVKKKSHQLPKPMFTQQNEQTIRQTKKNIQQKQVNMYLGSLKEDLHARISVSGADLKSLRNSIPLKLEEIFAVTRIPVAVLRAIEDDVVNKLPPAVFLKGYIKQYAECLGLDPAIIIPAYLNHLKNAL